MSTEIGGLTLWPSAGGGKNKQEINDFVWWVFGCQRGEIFIPNSMAPNLSQTHYIASIDLLFL